jgi:hypothetical protein
MYKQFSSLSKNEKANLFSLYYSRFLLSNLFYSVSFCKDLGSQISL